MKTTLIRFIFILFFIPVSMGQIIELSFTANRMMIHEQLDSIRIENLTQGGDTMLFYPDTVLVLSSLVGFPSIHGTETYVSPAFPNPSTEHFTFNVFLSSDEIVRISAFNILGKEILYHEEFCKSGNNAFELYPGASGNFYISITIGDNKFSLKLTSLNNQNNGPFIRKASSIDFPAKALLSGFSWQSGDNLRFTGYVTLGTNFRSFEVIEDNPVSNQLYTFIITDGIPCASEPLITDGRDGNQYYTVKIGNQCWMAENLRYLPAVYGSDTFSLTNPLYHVYDYEGTNVDTAKSRPNYTDYGVLYNWPAVMDGAGSSSSNPSGVQGICPTGWHVPSDAEWKELEMYIGMTQIQADANEWRGTSEGGMLKSTSSTYWNLPNTGASNSTSFSGMPGGTCFGGGFFYYIGNTGYFWSSTENGSNYAWFRALHYTQAKVYRSYFEKYFGYSVRCVRD